MTRVGLALVVKDEADLLRENLAFHAEVGCVRFLVYDNGSGAEVARAVEDAAREVDAVRVAWPDATPAFQVRAYDDAVLRFGAGLDWIGFVDCDEFLTPEQGATLPQVLDALDPGAAAVAVNWRMYGSSGRETPAPGRTAECYVRRAPDDFKPNKHVKPIVRPHAFRGAVNAHVAAVDGDWVQPNGAPVDWLREGVTRTTGEVGRLRVNHYFVRSRQDWARKLVRGYRDAERRPEDFDFYDRNEVLDPCAAPVAERARRRFAFARAVGEPAVAR